MNSPPVTLAADVDAPLPKLSQRWHYAKEQAISFLMQQGVENPDVISLAAGLVDSGSLPIEETREGPVLSGLRVHAGFVCLEVAEPTLRHRS